VRGTGKPRGLRNRAEEKQAQKSRRKKVKVQGANDIAAIKKLGEVKLAEQKTGRTRNLRKHGFIRVIDVPQGKILRRGRGKTSVIVKKKGQRGTFKMKGERRMGNERR